MSQDAFVRAARKAVNQHTASMRIDDEGKPSIALFHLLVSLLEWADVEAVDFDQEVENARRFHQSGG